MGQKAGAGVCCSCPRSKLIGATVDLQPLIHGVDGGVDFFAAFDQIEIFSDERNAIAFGRGEIDSVKNRGQFFSLQIHGLFQIFCLPDQQNGEFGKLLQCLDAVFFSQ